MNVMKCFVSSKNCPNPDMQRSSVFEETYQNYLQQIKTIDYLARADMLGANSSGNVLEIPLYDSLYLLSGDGIEAVDGAPVSAAVRVILCKYVLMCPDEIGREEYRLMTYREFKDAGPLISYFTTNTNKTIETTFTGKLQTFSERAVQLGGTLRFDESYDLSCEFDALPRIPVIVNFNDRDDLFPATCSILYRSTAQRFLDMECLAMTGTLLAGKLIVS